MRLRSALLTASAVVVFSALWIWFLAHKGYAIRSVSMNPTLRVGDYVWPSTLSYGASQNSYRLDLGLGEMRLFASMPRRGDVAAFKLPSDPKQIFFKRVVGLPGDRIQMKKGRLFINGEMVERRRLADLFEQDLLGRDGPVPTYEEILPGGVKHLIIEVEGDKSPYDDTEIYTVPTGHYFVMGDNRDNSTDSRVPREDGGVGMVPYENFIARIDLVLFSTERSERVFQTVR